MINESEIYRIKIRHFLLKARVQSAESVLWRGVVFTWSRGKSLLCSNSWDHTCRSHQGNLHMCTRNSSRSCPPCNLLSTCIEDHRYSLLHLQKAKEQYQCISTFYTFYANLCHAQWLGRTKQIMSTAFRRWFPVVTMVNQFPIYTVVSGLL